MGWAGTERDRRFKTGTERAQRLQAGTEGAQQSAALDEDGVLGAPGWDGGSSSAPGLEGRKGPGRSRLRIMTRSVAALSRIQRTEVAPQLQAETERIRRLLAGMKGSVGGSRLRRRKVGGSRLQDERSRGVKISPKSGPSTEPAPHQVGQAQHSYWSPASSPAVYPLSIRLFILSPA